MGAELEVDSEEWRVRKLREAFLLGAGFSQHAAFRLAMRFEIEKERAAALLKLNPDEAWVLDQLID